MEGERVVEEESGGGREWWRERVVEGEGGGGREWWRERVMEEGSGNACACIHACTCMLHACACLHACARTRMREHIGRSNGDRRPAVTVRSCTPAFFSCTVGRGVRRVMCAHVCACI
jgi:hypothetical protein